MGFLDFFTIGNFKKSPKGHWLFFPYGRSGQGYIIDSERSYKKLRWQMTIYLLVSVLFAILIIKIARMKHFIYFLLLIPLLFGQHFLIYHLYRHMTPTDEKWASKEVLKNKIVAHISIIPWLFMVFLIIILIASIYILFNDADNWFIALLGLIFFGFASGFLIKSIITRIKFRKEMKSSDGDNKISTEK